MKVGLLTFHRADNIGALLQAYALQTAVTEQGHDCEFIDLPQRKKAEYRDFIVANMKNADFFVKRMVDQGSQRKARFDDFRSRFLRISASYASYEFLNDRYDRFIAGSDQIWNYAIPDTDDRYFLPFAEPGKRYSYAASFGGENVPEGKLQTVSENLKAFREISVREESGRETVRKLCGRDCEVSVDPTFLLAAEQWNALTHPVSGRFVFVYMVQYSEGLMEQAKDYASSHGLDLKVMSASFHFRLGFDAWSRYGISDFLSFIRYADKVFTNSFHGSAFSLIYGKLPETAALTEDMKDRNSRITELLNGRDRLAEAVRRSKQYLCGILGEQG